MREQSNNKSNLFDCSVKKKKLFFILIIIMMQNYCIIYLYSELNNFSFVYNVCMNETKRFMLKLKKIIYCENS